MMPIKRRRTTALDATTARLNWSLENGSFIRLELVVPVHPLHYYPDGKHGIHTELHART